MEIYSKNIENLQKELAQKINIKDVLPLVQKNVNPIGESEDFEFAALSEAVNYRRIVVSEFEPYLKGGKKVDCRGLTKKYKPV